MLDVVVAISEADIAAIKVKLEAETFDQEAMIANRVTGPWRPLNGFIVYNLLLESDNIEVLSKLYPTSKIIGVWDFDGNQKAPFDAELWLAHQQDKVEINEEGEIIFTSRPTELEQVHRWAGWADRIF